MPSGLFDDDEEDDGAPPAAAKPPPPAAAKPTPPPPRTAPGKPAWASPRGSALFDSDSDDDDVLALLSAAKARKK